MNRIDDIMVAPQYIIVIGVVVLLGIWVYYLMKAQVTQMNKVVIIGVIGGLVLAIILTIYNNQRMIVTKDNMKILYTEVTDINKISDAKKYMKENREYFTMVGYTVHKEVIEEIHGKDSKEYRRLVKEK